MSPDWQDILNNKLEALFAHITDRDAARAIIKPILEENEGFRIAVACLKLAGTNLEELKVCVNAGLVDYRDILAWAESPRQMQLGPPGASSADRARARREDAEDYARWLSFAEV